MGGGGGKGGSASSAAQTQANIANQLFAETSGLRGMLFGTPGTPGQVIPGSTGSDPIFRKGQPFQAGVPGTPQQIIPGTPAQPGMIQDVLTGPNVFPAERESLESQFLRAREGIISAGPARGGLQASLLAENEMERARGLTGLQSLGQQRRIENVFRTGGLVTGQNQLSLGGLGSAAGTFSGLAGQQAALAGQLGQAAGLTAGLGLAGKGAGGAGKAAAPAAATSFAGMCWIAAALYGYGTEEFQLARWWIFVEWSGPIAAVARLLYRRFGERIARWPWALRLLRPWFDLAVQRARR